MAFAQGINPTLNVSAPATDAGKTTLILNVPADAKVRLAGNLTSQTGEVREYDTNRLPAGQAWENYTISVEATINGEVKTQEKTITLYAGDERKLDFDFGNTAPANRTAARYCSILNLAIDHSPGNSRAVFMRRWFHCYFDHISTNADHA